MSISNKFTWHTSPCLFLHSGLRYINWHRLGFKYGYKFVMKNLWQSCLIDIPANVLEILMLIFAPWLDFGNSNKTFFPFFLFNVPFACGVSASIVWTTIISAYLVESFLFYLLVRSYNWTKRPWTLNVRLKLRDWH
jgi:hypothetical protein